MDFYLIISFYIQYSKKIIIPKGYISCWPQKVFCNRYFTALLRGCSCITVIITVAYVLSICCLSNGWKWVEFYWLSDGWNLPTKLALGYMVRISPVEQRNQHYIDKYRGAFKLYGHFYLKVFQTSCCCTAHIAESTFKGRRNLYWQLFVLACMWHK